MSDSFIRVAPDSTDTVLGKTVDMDLVSTAAGASIYRQRADLTGDSMEALEEISIHLKQHTALLRAILATLGASSTASIGEDMFHSTS